MKLFFSIILVYFYIFGVRNITDYTDAYFKVFNELKDRHRIESIPTSHYSSSSVLFRSDLSAYAQFKKCIMRNSTESQLAQNRIEANASDHDFLDVQEDIFTKIGFYNRYFYYLSTSKSRNEAFVKVSVDYFNIYQSFKYQSLNHFKSSIYGTVN